MEKFTFFKKDVGFLDSVYLEKSHIGYRRGYRQAADTLSKHIADNISKNQFDSMTFPLLFIYRHYFELTIKEIIRKCKVLKESSDSTSNTHDLTRLWNVELRNAMQDIDPDFNDHEETIEITKAFNELNAIDQKAEEFRYPIKTDGNKSLSSLTFVDVQHFSETASKISNLLEGLESEIDAYLEWVQEQYAEQAEQFEREERQQFYQE